MDERRKKRPRDPIQLAKLIGDIATGQIEDRENGAPGESEHRAATEFARRGGLKGGRARAEKLTPERRREIAQKAAAKRWTPRSE